MSDMLTKIDPLIQYALDEHRNYWDSSKMSTIKKLRAIYRTNYWAEHEDFTGAKDIETADGYNFIESHMAALFLVDASITLRGDITNPIDDDLATAIANRWLESQRDKIEAAARMALLYPFSALKIYKRRDATGLDTYALNAIPPWEVLIDRESDNWDNQRFCGHIIRMSLNEAKERWPGKRWEKGQQRLVERLDSIGKSQDHQSMSAEMGDDYSLIEIVEIYDLLKNQLIFFSPSAGNRTGELERTDIPVYKYDGTPRLGLMPMFLSKTPESPLEGLSTLSRIYPQLTEKNILRSFWADAVRRDVPQWFVKAEIAEDQQLAKLMTPTPGQIIPVEGGDLDVIRQVPQQEISTDLQVYQSLIEADIQRGSLLASFTRGEQSKGATATEIAQLSAYTSSEIGKLARERNATVETAAATYIDYLKLVLEAEGEAIAVTIDSDVKLLSEKDLSGKLTIRVADGDSDPFSAAIKRQNLLQIGPTLVQLGADPQILREEIVRSFNLPKRLADAAPPVEAPAETTQSLEQALPGGAELPQ